MSVITTKVVVSKADAYGKNIVTLTSGMAGAQCEFEFSDEWTGLGKTIVFTAGSVTKYIANIGSTNIVTIPYEVLANAGVNLIVGIRGTSGTTIIIPTIYCSLGLIMEGTVVSGSEPGTITQSLYDQTVALLAACNTELTNIKETAIKSAAASVDANYGTPSVSLTLDWISSSDHTQGKKATFAFHNLKGCGISSVSFSSSNVLSITRDDGTITTFSGIATAISSMETTEASVEAAESLRVTAESGRVSAESSRVTAETGRVTAESARVTAEEAREAAKIVGATATVDSEVGTPSVSVTESEHSGGGKDLNFAFSNMKGETGETGEKGDTGESGVYIGTTAPTNPEIKVWINPDGEPSGVTAGDITYDATETYPSGTIGSALLSKVDKTDTLILDCST